jgi:hypothetical protein
MRIMNTRGELDRLLFLKQYPDFDYPFDARIASRFFV